MIGTLLKIVAALWIAFGAYIVFTGYPDMFKIYGREEAAGFVLIGIAVFLFPGLLLAGIGAIASRPRQPR